VIAADPKKRNPVTEVSGLCVNKKLGGEPSANHISKIHKSRIKNKPVPFL
jgi:hypothetical protein